MGLAGNPVILVSNSGHLIEINKHLTWHYLLAKGFNLLLDVGLKR